MINLRYHIVSLAAVFLALAIGVIAGTTVIDQALVKDLQRQRNADAREKARLREQSAELRSELDLWSRFGEALAPSLLRGRLQGHRALLFVEEGVDDQVLDALDDAVIQAGGTAAGRIVLTEKWRLQEQTSVEQLALALDAGPKERRELLVDAAVRLAARLRSPADARPDEDLLQRLARADFLALADLPDIFPPPNTVVVFVSAGDPARAPQDEEFAIPLLRRLGPLVTAVAEPLGVSDSLSDRVRGDAELRTRVATVDHVDTLPGRVALAIALDRLIENRGASHFGVRRRTSGVIPTVTAAPRSTPARAS